MEKEQEKPVLEALFERTNDYLETRVELLKLKAAKKGSELVSSIVSMLILTILGLFFLVLVNIGLAIWLGELLGNAYYGFFALAGFYLIVAIVIFAARNSLLKVPVANSIIKKLHA